MAIGHWTQAKDTALWARSWHSESRIGPCEPNGSNDGQKNTSSVCAICVSVRVCVCVCMCQWVSMCIDVCIDVAYIPSISPILTNIPNHIPFVPLKSPFFFCLLAGHQSAAGWPCCQGTALAQPRWRLRYLQRLGALPSLEILNVKALAET